MKNRRTTFCTAAFLLAMQCGEMRASGGGRLEPAQGCYFGVSLGSGDSIEKFSVRTGLRPAIYTDFFEFPLTEKARADMRVLFDQVRFARGMALITLEPNGGLTNVTSEACLEFVRICSEQENLGIKGILVRFAHEMNGNWNPWGQQPVLYREKFRLLAERLHGGTSRSAMMWAPSYGGGYPYGTNHVAAGTADFAALDTDGDGLLTQTDDAYEPFYPGDDAVDWVGLTLYHWGVQWPWLENELPETNSFARLLTGNYLGGNGDQTAVPDFYAHYCADGIRNKPLAIPETAAFFNPHEGGATELEIKRAWFHQLFNISGDTPEAWDVAEHFPKLKCVSWFDHYKLEAEQQQWIDWRLSGYAPVRAEFARRMRAQRDGRPWFLMASDLECAEQADCVSENGLPAILPLGGTVAVPLFVQAHTNCDLVAELIGRNLESMGSLRTRMNASTQAVSLNVTLERPLADGAAYHWHYYLAPTGMNEAGALVACDGVTLFAREIVPSFQVAAFPPVVGARSNFMVRVRYSASQSAVAVINVLDGRYQWQGGATAPVVRGEGWLDLPVSLRPGIQPGNYILDSFLSDSPTNWQGAMAISEKFPVRVVSAPDRDFINAVPETLVLSAGSVFRFTVEYVALTNRDLHIDLFDANTNFLVGALQPVPAGSGFRDMTLSHHAAEPGRYFITAFTVQSGETWREAAAWGPDREVTVVSPEYQAWAESHWGMILNGDPVGPWDDPDQDGACNGNEFAARTDPRNARDLLKPELVRRPAGLVLRWQTISGRRYQVFGAPAAGSATWSAEGDSVMGTGSVVEIAIQAGGPARFYKVQVLE